MVSIGAAGLSARSPLQFLATVAFRSRRPRNGGKRSSVLASACASEIVERNDFAGLAKTLANSALRGCCRFRGFDHPHQRCLRRRVTAGRWRLVDGPAAWICRSRSRHLFCAVLRCSASSRSYLRLPIGEPHGGVWRAGLKACGHDERSGRPRSSKRLEVSWKGAFAAVIVVKIG